MASPTDVFIGTDAQLKGRALLARSGDEQSLDIRIAPVAKESNGSSATYLRKGTVLVRLPNPTTIGGHNYGGFYVHYAPTGTGGLIVGQDEPLNCVVLKHDADVTEIAAQAAADGATYAEQYSVTAAAYNVCTVWEDQLIVDPAFLAIAELVQAQNIKVIPRR